MWIHCQQNVLHQVGGCQNLTHQNAKQPTKMLPRRRNMSGVLGTIADEIQLQQGTFLEFISDEALLGGGENELRIFRSAFQVKRLIFLEKE